MKKILTLLMLSALIASCKKNDFIETPNGQETTQKKEKIFFKDLNHFNNYLDQYKNNVVFRNYQIQSNSPEVMEKINVLVEDEAFASVFDEAGEVSIADVTYKISNQGTYFSLNNNSPHINKYITVDASLEERAYADIEGEVASPDFPEVPDYLISAKPNLQNAVLVDDEENIYYLGDGVYFKDGIEEYFDNTIADHEEDEISNNTTPTTTTPISSSGGTSTNFSYSSYFAPSVFEGLDLTGAKTVEFSDKNGEVLNNFGDKDRLVVQFKAKNFLIYSYVRASVRIDHKKKYWFGWRTLQNYDELRAGFVNLTLDYDLPSLANPKDNSPKNPIDHGVNPYLKKLFTINIDSDPFDLYRLTDILNIPSLPYNIRGIVEDLLDNPESLYTNVVNQQKNNAIQTLTNYVKTQLGSNITTQNKFSFAIPSNNYVTIPLIERKKTSEGAKISYDFGVQTAIVGISSDTFSKINYTFSPAKNPKIVSGAAFGAGKLNGIWKSAVLVKNKK